VGVGVGVVQVCESLCCTTTLHSLAITQRGSILRADAIRWRNSVDIRGEREIDGVWQVGARAGGGGDSG
jgi:hypothetical protein